LPTRCCWQPTLLFVFRLVTAVAMDLTHLLWSEHLKNRRAWKIGLASYLAALAFIGFWPEPVDKPFSGPLAAILHYMHALGVPRWFDYSFVEASANIALFLPFGAILASLFPNRARWQLTLIGTLVSISLELGQLLFMTARYPSLLDVVTNTAGTFVGVALVRCLSSFRDRQHASG